MSIIFFTSASLFFSGNVCAQLTHIKFQVRVSNVQSNMGDEDGFGAGDSDFQWEYSGTSNGSPAISGNGCYEKGGDNNPNVNLNSVFMNQTNPTTATSVNAQWRARENDDGDCDDDNDCKMSTFMTQTINVRSGSPCTWNNSPLMTSPAYCGGNYRLTFAHYWEPVANSPSSITESATGVLCVGSSRTLTAVFTDEATSGVMAETRWYTSGCSTTGHFATGNSITVNPSSTTNYYARRVITSTCGSGNFSVNCASITITVVGPAPSLVDAGSDVTICSGSSVQLNGSATAPILSGSTSATFSSGDGSSEFIGTPTTANNSSCPINLAVSIPAGAVITGVNVSYNMTALGGAWLSEQRSYLECTSSGGVKEASMTNGPGSNSAGTNVYSRSNLTIANGVSGGGTINFRLHAFRTWQGSGTCNVDYNRVDNNTFTVTVFYNYPPVTYSWSPATFLSATNVANPTASNVTVAQTYTMTATFNGCSATDEVTINVNTVPSQPSAISGTASICSGVNQTYSVTNVSGVTYAWTYSGTGTITGTGNSITLNATTGGTLTVTPSNSCGNGTARTLAVSVNPNLPASVSIAASSTTICSGTSVTFTATPTNGGTTPSYQWKVNGANVGTNSPTFTSAALTNGQAVTCEMTSNATPCLTGSPATSNTVTMTVTPSVAASVSIAATPGTNVCIGTNVTFTATPTNGGTPSYQWKLDGLNVGTNSSTYSNNALTNTSVVTCVMTSTATCATGSPATSNLISGIVPAAPTSIAGTASAVCQVPAGSGWVRFLDGSGKLVVSINPGSNNLGLVTADAYDHGSSVLTQACNTGTNPEWTTAVLGRSWKITPTNNLGASLELPFEDGEMSNLVTASSNTASNPRDNVISRGDLKMSRYSGASQNGSWSDNCADGGTSLIGSQLGNGTSPAGIAASQYVQFATPGFSEFWLHGNTTASPLPITLTNFGASCDEKGDVALNWSTASEQNASHFVIERSRDLVTWNVVSTLPAGGNTTTEQLYALTDVDALGGVSYYRLVQVDFDGESEIYGPISVTCESATVNAMTVFPNPTNGEFTVEINTDKTHKLITISILDLTGKILINRDVEVQPGANTFYFNDQLESGTYLIRIRMEGEVKTLRLVMKN